MSCALIPCVGLSMEVGWEMGDGVALGSTDWKRPPEAGTQTWVSCQLFWDSGWGLRLNQGSGKKTTISSSGSGEGQEPHKTILF